MWGWLDNGICARIIGRFGSLTTATHPLNTHINSLSDFYKQAHTHTHIRTELSNLYGGTHNWPTAIFTAAIFTAIVVDSGDTIILRSPYTQYMFRYQPK